MTNIYQKQMNKLNLNAKQYAELTGMPYEVVKDILYNKKGDYSMEIKSFLRKNMINKHQDIENNFENAKIKALELKQENNSMNWYINEYTPELLKETLNLKSRKAFEEKYDIIIDNKTASHWFYTCILGKTNYDNHEIRKAVVEQFTEQLYDILVNGNKEKYLRKSVNKIDVKNKQANALKWFKKFNIKKYLEENDLTQTEFCNRTGLDKATLCRLIQNQKKQKYETNSIRKLYNYVMGLDTKDNDMKQNEKIIISNDLTNEELETLKEQPQVITSAVPEVEFTSSNDDIMRKILVSRLTDEERALIELFGGKIC